MKSRRMSLEDVDKWVCMIGFNPVIAILLQGDRLSCCDEAVGLEVDGLIVGVATISSQGEDFSGNPTIVGVYVQKPFRSKGYGLVLMTATVRRCIELGFHSIAVDSMSKGMMKTIKKLPDELQNVLNVRDMGDMISILDKV